MRPLWSKFSIGTAIISGSLGALAMFAALASLGLIAGRIQSVESDSALTGNSEPGTATNTSDPTPHVADGAVAVRIRSNGSMRYGAGIKLNDAGHVVTTLNVSADSTGIAIETGADRWTQATVVGSDAVTGLTVIAATEELPMKKAVEPTRGQGGLTESTTTLTTTRLNTTTPANVSRSSQATNAGHTAMTEVGDRVLLVRPGHSSLASNDAVQSVDVASTNVSITLGSRRLLGLTALITDHPQKANVVAMDEVSGQVVGLIIDQDDDDHDRLAYALPATLARKIGLQILADGAATHCTIAATLGFTAENSLVVHAIDPLGEAALRGLAVGDEIIRVGDTEVHTPEDVEGALLGTPEHQPIPIIVRRNNHEIALEVLTIATSPDVSAEPPITQPTPDAPAASMTATTVDVAA